VIRLALAILVSCTISAAAVAQPRDDRSVVLAPDSTGNRYAPGATTRPTSVIQDSLFKDALRVQITAAARFHANAAVLGSMATATAPRQALSPWESMMANMDIPREILAPAPQEIVQHQINIMNSMYVPGVLLYPMGMPGTGFSMNAIGALLGLVEDVSPAIKYDVNVPSDVEILIYSPDARVVASLFSGEQQIGSYSVTWNGRDDRNRVVRDGEYIAEVHIGNSRIVRKRIVWPPRK
jgi:hypothetical protein